MGFNNPIVGGTALRIPAIQSPNYDPGVAGWIIKINGDAEFNDLTVRGEFLGTDFIINSSGIFLYSATPASGNLIGSWTGAAGTDGFGNAYAAGFTLYSSAGEINFVNSGGDILSTWTDTVNGTQMTMGVGGGSAGIDAHPPTTGGVTWQEGGISSFVSNVHGAHTSAFAVSSGYNAAHASSAQVALYGSSDSSSANRVDVTTQTLNVSGDENVSGILSAANRVVGSVLITPSAANTPTSASISYGPLTGSTFRGVCSPETTVAGTSVTGWALTSITSTGALVWVTRANTTATRIDYIIEGF